MMLEVRLFLEKGKIRRVRLVDGARQREVELPRPVLPEDAGLVVGLLLSGETPLEVKVAPYRQQEFYDEVVAIATSKESEGHRLTTEDIKRVLMEKYGVRERNTLKAYAYLASQNLIADGQLIRVAKGEFRLRR